MHEYYFPIKHLHVTAVVLSITLFIIRSWWSVMGSDILQKRWVRIVPHVIDTALLTGGVLLAMIFGPEQPWILTKIVLLLAYIGVGTLAIKRGRTRKTGLISAVIAVLIFLYIVGVAYSKNPASWFSWL